MLIRGIDRDDDEDDEVYHADNLTTDQLDYVRHIMVTK
jgi:hypothetical protein